jgi:hypothetical protein
LWLSGLVAYVVLFYASPLPGSGGESRRVVFLSYLLLPEVLATDWFGTPPEFSLADRFPVLLIAGMILAYVWSLGWLLMTLCGADRGLTRLEGFVFAVAVGLNLVSTYVLAAGLLGGLHRLAFALPAVLTLAAAGGLWWRRALAESAGDRPGKKAKTHNAKPPAEGKEEDHWLSPRWLWLAAPFVLLIFLGGLLPPVDFDVREYHLQVPKEFFQQGRIGFLPHNVYGNMAMGSEMHSLLAMVIADDWWLGALAGKTVIAAMTPLTALALFAAGRRLFSTAAGVMAALLYISIPWIVNVSTAGLVEGASAYYLLLSVYAILLWGRGGEEMPSSGSPARKGGVVTKEGNLTEPRPSGRGYSHGAGGWGYSHLLLAGYLAGGAVACKYPAVLFVLLPLGAWVFFAGVGWDERSKAHRESVATTGGSGGPRSARPTLQACKPVGVFLLAALLGCGLWFGKNWVLTGNPTYPLLYSVFDGKTRTLEKNRQWINAHRPQDFSPAALAKDLGRVGLTSEWLSPLVVPLAVLALRERRCRLVIGLWAYFGYMVVAWWLWTHRIDRFWIPALPLLALMGGAGACWSRQRWWRRVLTGMLVAGLVVDSLAADLAVGYRRYFVSLDRLRRDADRVDPWHRYLNTHVGRGRVLTVGDAQVFDLEVPVLYNTCFDDCLFEQLVRGRSAAEIRAALAARGISYVYVDWGEIQRYRSPGNYGFTDFVQPLVFEELVRQGVLEPLPGVVGPVGPVYRVRAD